ncbi:MAG: TonB-dependent receptor [Gammaproteobacteria bacterium]|nr:TonB-dependent receptor [Gammaproteobacteria bacterium]
MNTNNYMTLFSAALIALASQSSMAAEAVRLDEVTVTGEREGKARAQEALTVNGVDGETIREVLPTHPSDIMNRVAGVLVNITQGEGHMAAIRQPLSTSPVYLYLEDGIPARSTGFFNHNALYETNMPQSDGVEVLKGPGTALYGSDALGGIVNVLTRPAPETAEAGLIIEGGSSGYSRVLVNGGNGDGSNGYRVNAHVASIDGWRDNTEYDRGSVSMRMDNTLEGGDTVKTILGYSKIDQQTAGASALSLTDYKTDPTINYTPISYRNVTALRLSTSWDREGAGTLTSITPYLRHNVMDILPNWSLSYDPAVYTTFNDSLGLLVKHRVYLPDKVRYIIGTDIDYSPGGREETAISPVRVGSVYESYAEGALLYDYKVSFASVSPYVHGEMMLGQNGLLSAGLRYDMMQYEYDSELAPLATGNHQRPDDTTVKYRHASPKLGYLFSISPNQELFASYRHGYRAPSEAQLFRQGSAANTVELEPVKLDSYELGWRWRPGKKASTELSLYSMTKTDDILVFNNPVSGLTEVVNAGETSHKGAELTVVLPVTEQVQLDTAWSYAVHTYEDWVVRAGAGNIDYSGNIMSSAPRVIGNTTLRYGRRGQFNAELQWTHLGEYWMDDANTHKYNGHGLLGMIINIPLADHWRFRLRGYNLADRLYSERASYTAFRGEEFAPGAPRLIHASIAWQWQGASP